jgi:acetylornithine deacetylase/succinyl-diaminopimelate desuccinylase-like protein
MKMRKLMAVSVLATQWVLSSPASGATSQDQEMEAIAARPEILRALEVVRELEPRSEKDLIELTEIPAPPFKEEARARRYQELLAEAGVDRSEIDEEGNVVALRKGAGSGRLVALAAHLDTVFPEGTDVTVRREGDKFLAPGIGDDTRGLVVVLAVLRALNQARVKTNADIWFIGTVGEEGLGDLRGVKHLFREGAPRISSFIAIDGGGLDSITNGGLGSVRYRVTFKGPGGHSWGAFGLANPGHAIGRAIYYFDEEAAEYVSAGARTSYNVGRMGGGTSVNAIPFENWMEVDMRSESAERLAGIDAILKRAVERALRESNEARFRRRGDPLTVQIDKVGDRPSGVTDPATPLVARALSAIRLLTGKDARLSTGSTDSNVPIARGIPAVTLGRGGEGGGAHALHEWWSNKEGHLGIQAALLTLVAEAGLP